MVRKSMSFMGKKYDLLIENASPKQVWDYGHRPDVYKKKHRFLVVKDKHLYVRNPKK